MRTREMGRHGFVTYIYVCVYYYEHGRERGGGHMIVFTYLTYLPVSIRLLVLRLLRSSDEC